MTFQKLVDKGKIVLTQGPGLEGQISWAGFCLQALEYIFLGTSRGRSILAEGITPIPGGAGRAGFASEWNLKVSRKARLSVRQEWPGSLKLSRIGDSSVTPANLKN